MKKRFVCQEDSVGKGENEKEKTLLSFVGDYLEPVSVRIRDEVYPHCLVFITDAVHFHMFAVGGFIIIGDKGEMQFIVAVVVRLFSISEPGEFNLVEIGRASCRERV